MKRRVAIHALLAVAISLGLFALWPHVAELYTRWLLAVQQVVRHRTWLPIDLGHRPNLRFAIPAVAIILSAIGRPFAKRLWFAFGLLAVHVVVDTAVVATGLVDVLAMKPDPRDALLGSVATALVFHALDVALPIAALAMFFDRSRSPGLHPTDYREAA